MTQPLSPRPDGGLGASAACIAGLMLVAWLIYRPDIQVPFDLLDTGEFLPIVSRRAGLVDGIAGLLQYFATQGRANIGVYAYIALNWNLYGLDSGGWQLTLWAVMASLTALVFGFARAVGASRGAATLAAGLFVVASPAAGAWIRLTGEPIATICFVGAMILSIRYHRMIRWEAAAFAIVLLLTAMMLTKEILLCLVPIVLLAAWYGDRLITAIDGRLASLMAAVLVAAMLCIAWSFWALFTAPQEAYARSYGAGMDLSGRLGDVFLTILLPQRERFLDWRVRPLIPANLLFLLGIGIAWVSLLLRRRRIQEAGTGLVLAGVLVTVGSLAYWPWPRFESFYALPFMLAPVVLVGWGLTEVGRGNRILAAVAYGCIVAAEILSAADAHRLAGRTRARRTVESAAAAVLATYPVNAMLARRGVPVQVWQQTGPTMQRYAVAMGWLWHPPTARDVPCGEMNSSERTAKVVRLVYVNECGNLGAADHAPVHYYRYINPLSLRADLDSVRIDIIGPIPPRSR